MLKFRETSPLIITTGSDFKVKRYRWLEDIADDFYETNADVVRCAASHLSRYTWVASVPKDVALIEAMRMIENEDDTWNEISIVRGTPFTYQNDCDIVQWLNSKPQGEVFPVVIYDTPSTKQMEE